MPDWHALVRQRLATLGLAAAREEEIRAELAEHLEDAYQHGLARGCTPAEAEACAEQQVANWNALAARIRREETMSTTTRTLWLPGTSVMLFAALFGLAIIRVVPPPAWVDERRPWLAAAWLALYLVLGGLGAYWSRRAGGTLAQRLLSGAFPLILHLAIACLTALAALFSPAPAFPEHLRLSFWAGIALGWVLIPGAALALGALPFLRDSTVKKPLPAS